ncbi:MAG TPA: acetoin utilization protein AcuC [Ktedonobacteraceae bacterium]|nr:acetoin utilization protein AcuC [Ktedonobacteraceae bacterium]
MPDFPTNSPESTQKNQHHHNVRLLFDPRELHYDFGPEHPLNPARVKALVELLESSGLWHAGQAETQLASVEATLEQLALVHTPDYIAAVQRLSRAELQEESAEERHERARLAFHYGFGDGDTPVQPHMHEISALIAGGTLVALSAVLGLPAGGSFATEEERPLHVFHPAGGLHHAWAERASGFCIYNDASVAIAYALRSSDAKILYLDFDAHHGDGVQRMFYDDSRVLTVSIHETGRYLFPGTGEVLEMGRGNGRGYSVNVPLEPFTEDDSYNELLESLLPPLVTSFAPDVIISNHGCDTHAWDPLTHLSLTMRGIRAQVQATHQLAHDYCQGRWVALGGGGYDLYRVVPRAWSILWSELSEQQLPELLPETWVQKWQPAWLAEQLHEQAAQELMGKANSDEAFPATFMDSPAFFPPQPRRWTINHTNRHTVALVRHLLVPSSVRQAFPSRRQRSPLTDLFDLLHMNREGTPSRSKILHTSRGQVLLRDFCPPSFVERLHADSGLHAFARLPEREYQLLRDISQNADSALTLAYTPNGEIVGQVTIAPADDWWEGIENLYEVAVEVSSHWRGLGIARNLLAYALALDAREDMIFFAIGLSWHWEAEELGISIYRYRELLTHLFSAQGFKEYPTTEPNVSMEPANVLLARIGSRVDPRVASQFLNRLLSSHNLSGI